MMEELVKHIVSALIDSDDVTVTSKEESDKVTILNIKVKKDDMGKVIGKNGKVASAIRAIVKSASSRMNKRFIVKIGE